MFGPVRPWNNDNDNTRDNLRSAMAQNPYLMVLNQSVIMMERLHILMPSTHYHKLIPVGK